MAYLTDSYLEGLGFSLSWSQEHSYHDQYTKYDKDVTKAIILVAKTDIDKKKEYVFDVWFWGQTSQGDYREIDSRMSISTTKELDNVLRYLS